MNPKPTSCTLLFGHATDLRKIVERRARDNRLKDKITPADVYESHPPQEKLFPSPIDFAFDAHGK